MQALVAGRFDDAERLIGEAAALARTIGEADGPVVEVNQRWELSSDLARRPEMLDTLERFAAYTSHEAIWLSLALARLATGDRSGGHAALDRVAAADVSGIRPAYARPWVAALLVEAAVALDRPELAPLGRAALEAASGSGVVVGGAVAFHGAADHHLGVLCAACGARDDAVDHLTSALAFHQRIGARPWTVRTQLALRDVLGQDSGHSGRASVLDRSARATAAEIGMPVPDGGGRSEEVRSELSRTGDIWTFVHHGTTTRVKHAKGLQDLSVMLARPGDEVAAGDLVFGADLPLEQGADAVLDAEARRSYGARIEHLEAAMARADHRGDVRGSTAAAAERDQLLTELRVATGLGGRDRRLGDPSERSRKAVAARLRDVIGRIRRLDPVLGEHLARCVSTGTRCVYRPDPPTVWTVKVAP